ncbi:hypothetical protein PsorP6_011768 [Peronosclerospora sorghi]|uniref:Uncharacterized protein n=1 Tax=Peronosclerospora sorghi TaxID=230839 RepID=A0ACC0WIL0_9STRA|nr:hypothetical protein PsorP6_011768 [Peronosclerospora sorghi]
MKLLWASRSPPLNTRNKCFIRTSRKRSLLSYAPHHIIRSAAFRSTKARTLLSEGVATHALQKGAVFIDTRPDGRRLACTESVPGACEERSKETKQGVSDDAIVNQGAHHRRRNSPTLGEVVNLRNDDVF